MSKGKTAKGTSTKQIEMRRCLACRTARHKSELVRVVKTAAGTVAIDTTGKVDGRGAYICRSPECAALLKKRRNLDKVFKLKVPDELYDKISSDV